MWMNNWMSKVYSYCGLIMACSAGNLRSRISLIFCLPLWYLQIEEEKMFMILFSQFIYEYRWNSHLIWEILFMGNVTAFTDLHCACASNQNYSSTFLTCKSFTYFSGGTLGKTKPLWLHTHTHKYHTIHCFESNEKSSFKSLIIIIHLNYQMFSAH